MTERPSPFCPDYCNFLSDDFQQAIANGETYDVCGKDCHHKDDKVVDPPIEIEVMRWRDHFEPAEIIGRNNGWVYIRSESCALSSILENGPLMRKRG